jgi:hypothetical protein
MIGGAGTVATGSLSKGLMMGLGAYGGAGLGAGLMGSAAAAAPAASALSTAVSPAVGAGQVLTGAGLAGSPAAAAAAAPAAAAPAAGNFAGISGTNVNAMTGLPPPSAPTMPNPVNTMQQGQAAYADYMARNPVVNAPAQSVQSATSGFVDRLKSMPSKAYDLLTGSGQDADKAREEFLKQNKNYLIASGVGVLGASRDDPRKPKETQYDIRDYDWNTRNYSPSSQVPGSTGERTYFAADGGLMGLPVEQMSQHNAMSDNTRYPMAFQKTPNYSMPSQGPISQNVVYPATDTGTNTYSGSERGMASGGVVALAEGGLSKQEIQKQIDEIKAKPRGTAMGAKIYSDEQNKQIRNLQAQLKTASAQPTGVASVAPKNAQTTAEPAGRPGTTIGSRSLKTAGGGNREDIQAQIDEIMANPTHSYQAMGGSQVIYSDAQQKQLKYLRSQLTKPKEVLRADGTWGPEEVTPKYQKIGYGKINATSGWDTESKYIEDGDVNRVFEEVVGRAPNESELSKYVGTESSLQNLVNRVNKETTDLYTNRKANPFTDDELQSQAKYYWGREMTDGELANYKKANLVNFSALRNKLTSEKMYVDNLNAINQGIVDEKNKPAVTPASKIDISSVFVDTFGRKPTKKELNDYFDQKISKDDLIKKLKESDEFISRLYQPEEQVDENGNVITTPTGGGTGLVPPITYTPGTMTKAEMDAYTRQYASNLTPSAYAAAGSGAAAPSGTASGTSPYQPLTGPEFSIAGSLPYQDINKQLGLTGLYNQMSAKMPELQQGLNFNPTQGAAMASPFANVTPGLVTLQSVATPQPYVPPTPIIPGSQNYSPALTPEEQALLSNAQSQSKPLASGGMTSYNLGGYSDGGRLLKGPGDGVSDSIPATIGDRQPARLADGEFVVPARIVSELGNGSTDAGARKLYAMMERIQRARRKTVGKNKVAVKSGADKLLPA